MRFKHVGELPHQLAPILRRSLRPGADLESTAGGFDGFVDIGRIGLGHSGNSLTCCRVKHVEPFARFRAPRFSVDQQLVLAGEKAFSCLSQLILSCGCVHGSLLERHRCIY